MASSPAKIKHQRKRAEKYIALEAQLYKKALTFQRLERDVKRFLRNLVRRRSFSDVEAFSIRWSTEKHWLFQNCFSDVSRAIHDSVPIGWKVSLASLQSDGYTGWHFEKT